VALYEVLAYQGGPQRRSVASVPPERAVRVGTMRSTSIMRDATDLLGI